MSALLSRLLERVREESSRGRAMVVFDLDSTLFSTAERNFYILKEFASQPAAPPELRLCLERLTSRDMGWNVMDDLKRHGFQDRAVLRELRQFWFDRFFKNDYLRHDRPIPGAVEFVTDLHHAGGNIFYLTGRDEPGMGRGTRDSLRAHGFPLERDRVTIRLKPRFEDSDLVFKRAVIEELSQAGDVIAAFENEPVNANLFADAFPRADVILLETVHSPNPPPLVERVHRIKDFIR
jgi:hypothetical protein